MENIWVQFISNLGGAGILALVMYRLANRFMDETVKQMTARIIYLEKQSEMCEADRIKLHEQFAEVLLKQIHPKQP